MANFFYFYFFLISLSLTQSCDIFVGMTCTCYDSIDLRCTMTKMMPLTFISPSVGLTKKFHSIDLKIETSEKIQLDENYFIILNQLFPSLTRNSLSITFRFQNFQSFHAKTSSFASLFNGISSPHKRLMIELHPVKAESIIFDQNTFNKIQVNELSIYADSLTSSFESIFDNTNITHLNIEGAVLTHDPFLAKRFTGNIQSLKVTRMIDTVNNEEFPPFPVQSYTIEAHKMRTLDAYSFLNYTHLTGLNIIQPDVSITPKLLSGLENISTLKSVSLDADRIAEGALRNIKQIETLILGQYLKILDVESLNSLKSLKQLDVRYIHFSTLQGNTSCALADYINRRRMLGLTVYLPNENPDCDCILVFLNNMVDDGSQLIKCQSTHNDRCLFSSCPIVSEYFTRRQKEDIQEQQNTPPTLTEPPPQEPFVPPSIDFNDNGSPYYPDDNVPKQELTTTSYRILPTEDNMYGDEEEIIDNPLPTTASYLLEPDELDNQFSTPLMKRIHPDSKKHQSNKYLVVSWIPFAIIATCLLLSLIVAMIGYIIYHRQRTASFKLVPQAAPII